jgi:C1A family cysteine protease
MYYAGKMMGGHCTVANAYDPECPFTDGMPAVRIQNSYGTAWGIDGAAWLPVSDLASAIGRRGEALVLA